MTLPTEFEGASIMITDRDAEESLKFLKISENDLKVLPQNPYILDVGSGIHQKMANHIKEVRPDSKVFSIDPSLAINPEDIGRVDKYEGVGGVVYIPAEHLYEPPTNEAIIKIREHFEERRKIAVETGGVIAALAPDLPFVDNRFDLIMDLFGPGLYLERTPYEIPPSSEKVRGYYSNLIRILKKDGKAIIFPIDLETDQDKLKKAYENLVKGLAGDTKIEVEFFGDTSMVGMKITKK